MSEKLFFEAVINLRAQQAMDDSPLDGSAETPAQTWLMDAVNRHDPGPDFVVKTLPADWFERCRSLVTEEGAVEALQRLDAWRQRG